MEIPIEITAHNFELLDHMEGDIRARAQRLERYFEKIERCHVVVDVPHAHKAKAHRYCINIRITVPGAELMTDRQENEDFHVAVRDAFNAARRQLADYARVRRGQVKEHEARQTGRVARIDYQEGFGFIEAGNGDEIYFHENSLIDASLDAIDPGIEVRFLVEQGAKGLQATTVEVLSRQPATKLPCDRRRYDKLITDNHVCL